MIAVCAAMAVAVIFPWDTLFEDQTDTSATRRPDEREGWSDAEETDDGAVAGYDRYEPVEPVADAATTSDSGPSTTAVDGSDGSDGYVGEQLDPVGAGATHLNLNLAEDTTAWSDYRCSASWCKGKPNMQTLMKQSVSCGDRGLNRFQYEGENYERIRYKIGCLGFDGEGAGENKLTAPRGHGNLSTEYLDQHTLNCGNKAINSFLLKWSPDVENKVVYDYTCNVKAAAGDCRELKTDFQEKGWKTKWLDRHNVKCDVNEVITKFKLESNEQNRKFRYRYTCCQMEAQAPAIKKLGEDSGLSS